MTRERRQILPAVTEPWDRKIRRRHKPPRTAAKDAWRSYRPCLRWEFAFSCAFCLLHEADLATAGVEGWGLTALEHFVPKSKDSTKKNDPANLFYICGRCNRARWTADNQDEAGAVLLNPCMAPWGEKFVASEGTLELRDERDADARYTEETYKLNDKPKVRIRRERQRMIERHRPFLERTRGKRDMLFERALDSGDPELIDLAKEIRGLRQDAILDLLKFRAVPRDRDRPCRCKSRPSLPGFLEEQTFDLLELVDPDDRL